MSWKKFSLIRPIFEYSSTAIPSLVYITKNLKEWVLASSWSLIYASFASSWSLICVSFASSWCLICDSFAYSWSLICVSLASSWSLICVLFAGSLICLSFAGNQSTSTTEFFGENFLGFLMCSGGIEKNQEHKIG